MRLHSIAPDCSQAAVDRLNVDGSSVTQQIIDKEVGINDLRMGELNGLQRSILRLVHIVAPM